MTGRVLRGLLALLLGVLLGAPGAQGTVNAAPARMIGVVGHTSDAPIGKALKARTALKLIDAADDAHDVSTVTKVTNKAMTARPIADSSTRHVLDDGPSIKRTFNDPPGTRPSRALTGPEAPRGPPHTGPGAGSGAAQEAADAAEGAGAVGEAFHYTDSKWLSSMMENGLRPGTYATPNGTLSPLQRTLDLALPPNRALTNSTVRIDVEGLRQAGYEIPQVTRVSGAVSGAGGRVYTMPGGGYEMQFPYAIPPEFLKVVP